MPWKPLPSGEHSLLLEVMGNASDMEWNVLTVDQSRVRHCYGSLYRD